MQQSINATTYTKIQFNTEVYDTDGEFDNATNYRFTASVAGYYSVKTVMGLASLDQDKYINTTIRVNNVVKASTDNYLPATATDLRAHTSKDLYLAQNDYVEVFIYHTSSGAENTLNDINTAFLTIHRFA